MLVRPGREEELSRKELADLKKSRDVILLELRTNGSFNWKKAFEGTYKQSGAILTFQPERFSGQTLAEMRRKSEEMGRAFILAFIFEPFKLQIDDGRLVSADQSAPLYMEYRHIR